MNLNSDADFTDTGEHDDTRTHAPVNEMLTRDLDSNPGTTGNNYSLAYNLRGDLEDEGGTGGYKYIYDAFGRLVEVRKQNSDLIAAYRYNGLNQRITWHYDATGNGTTDGPHKRPGVPLLLRRQVADRGDLEGNRQRTQGAVRLSPGRACGDGWEQLH